MRKCKIKSYIPKYYEMIHYLTNVDIMKRVDALACLLNIFSNGVRKQLVYDLLQVTRSNIACDDFHHLLADCSYLRICANSMYQSYITFKLAKLGCHIWTLIHLAKLPLRNICIKAVNQHSSLVSHLTSTDQRV
jgi:hypothetical protein